MTTFNFLFIILTVILAYIYVGYPLVLCLLAKLFPRHHLIDSGIEPSVTLIISAYNEEKDIEEKLLNALSLDYPPEKLSIIVVSDGSSDRTDEIVCKFTDRGVILVRPPERRGKTSGLNLALTQVKSDIVVFSDANAIYDRFAIRVLVRHFADEKVGYAVGYARYENSDETSAGSSEDTYWNLEILIKEWESAFSSVVGGDGAIYAIRSQLYEPLLETDINDFVNPLQIVAKGYRGVFDVEAWCTEKPAGQFDKEFSRKVRIANRSFNGLLRVPAVCNPMNVGRFAWQVISHKLLRWFSPFILFAHFVSAMVAADTNVIAGVPALCFTVIYGLVAALALVGWWQDKRSRTSKLFYIPYYFMLMNMASSIGVTMRLKGKVISIWETVREKTTQKNIASTVLPFLLLGIIYAVTIRISVLLGVYQQVLHLLEYVIIVLLFHTYLGYPLILWLLAKLRPVNIDRDEDFLPTVTLLITAYNEEREIETKLLNSLALNYPANCLRIVVASDGSDDETNSIVQKYGNRVELLSFPHNRGKIAAINETMESNGSEIVVFSDANAMYEAHALRKLVRNFSDPRVGAVSGRVILLNEAVSYKESEKRYYSIEHFIQAKEGATGAMVGADGAMYAIRSELFFPPSSDTILDDFVIAMRIAMSGYLVIYEGEALGYEYNRFEMGEEFCRKTRIIAGGFQCILRGDVVPGYSQVLLLFKFISHKVLRWFSGLMIIVLFLLLSQSIVADSFSNQFLIVVQWSMAGAAVIAACAYYMPMLRKILPVNFVYYFFMLMGASLMGLYRELSGSQKVTWRGGAL